MRRLLLRLLRRLGLGLLAIWALAVLALLVFQRTLLFPVPRHVGLPRDIEIVWVDYDGGRVPLAVRGALDGSAPVAVWFHGNGGQVGQEARVATRLGERGVSAALAEFPGYGAATGAGPSEANFLAAARASLEVLAGRGAPAPACVGHSMGSGVAAALAAEGRCSRLVLLAPYTSLPAVAWEHYPFVPTFLMLDRLDTLGRAPNIRVPTLIVHGRSDPVVPVGMGRALAAAITGARIIETDGNHNSILNDATWDAVAEFIVGP